MHAVVTVQVRRCSTKRLASHLYLAPPLVQDILRRDRRKVGSCDEGSRLGINQGWRLSVRAEWASARELKVDPSYAAQIGHPPLRDSSPCSIRCHHHGGVVD